MEYILKIGGSILTDKTSKEKLSEDFSEIIERVAQHPKGVIIHGAGSFGHPHAKEHGLASGSHEGVLETHRSIKKLNRKVVDKLRQEGVKAIPIHPSSMSFRDQETDVMVEHVKAIVDEGFTPVMHGDTIVTPGKGFTVLSGDHILAKLEKTFNTGKAGFCSSVEGVFNSKGAVLEEITGLDEFEELEIEGVDVSGGMKNKIEEILKTGTEARIFGVKDLEKFLEGEKVGTKVH